jgi:peptidoglycan/LPS O-acetylase OafA/YrhL
MRAVAVLLVLVIHVGAASGANLFAWYGVATSQGRMGVRIFFVISAFLLYRPWAMAHLRSDPPPRLPTYAKRRVLRILPAYWVALTLLALWPGLPGVWTQHWWIYYGILQSYWFFTIYSGLAVAWSLSIEVAFYVLLPILARGLGRLGRGADPHVRLRREIAALALLGLAAEAFRIHAFTIDRRDLNFNLASMFLPFAVGMILALVSAWLGRDERRFRWTRFVVDHPDACWVAALVVFAAGCWSPVFMRAGADHHTTLTWALEQLAYVAIATLLLLPAIFGENGGGWSRRLLATPAMEFLGRISYGIFLWHLPLVGWIAAHGGRDWIPGFPFLSLFLAGLAVSIPMGWLSYRLVERPAMRLRQQPPGRVGDGGQAGTPGRSAGGETSQRREPV